MKINYCDALVIGGGLAGLRAAVAAADKGLNAVVLSLVPVRRSHSAAAQGGMQASLGNSAMSKGDNEDLHFSDTVKGSDWGCDQEVARMFVNTAPKATRELAAWGVPWSRIEKGSRTAIIDAKKTTITEEDERVGLITSRDFGGTKKWRTCFTGDATGHCMLFGIANEAVKRNIKMIDRVEAVSLIHNNGVCHGAVVRDLITGELFAYVAKGTILATGGYGRLYKTTTNAVICEGTGHNLALDTGLVPMGNMEAVQFHPTPIVPSCILLTEGCRGDGGILRDKDGHRFMPDYEPEKKELASRDVVSRRMMEHIAAGKGLNDGVNNYVWLDISILGRKHIERNLRDVQDIAISFNGIDPAVEGPDGWLPVHPAQHYSMGGIRTDRTGACQGIKGLYAAGEAACWDMHGFNRLGGNSVTEAVVTGMIIGNYWADYCLENELSVSTKVIEDAIQAEETILDDILAMNGPEDIFKIKARMQEIMDEKVGVFRNGPPLAEAVVELEELYKKCSNITVKLKNRNHNAELLEGYRVPKMLKLALCVAQGASLRTESRGAHFREDYLKRDDEKWLNRTLAKWPVGATMPEISYESVDIMTMEMPPAYRGYGAKGNIILHPDSAKRQDQVDAITKKMKKAGKNRIEIQDAILPYRLQPEYKALNARVGD